MDSNNNWIIFLPDKADKTLFVQQLLRKQALPAFQSFNQLDGLLFSPLLINEIVEEEERHDCIEVATAEHRI